MTALWHHFRPIYHELGQHFFRQDIRNGCGKGHTKLDAAICFRSRNIPGVMVYLRSRFDPNPNGARIKSS